MIRTALRKAFRRWTGYDIHKMATGQDADWDIQSRVNHWSPVIFDVGANEGQTSKRLREIFPTGVCVCFRARKPV
jgi:hypothetical protein